MELTVSNFSLAQICSSGQCFRMGQREDGTYALIAADRYLEASQEGQVCRFFCGEEEFHSFWKSYFDLENDYKAYIDRISPEDRYLNTAAQYGSGIRILRQDLWEMIVSFLISQQNHIARIRRCIGNICREYGEKRINERGFYYAFPGPEALARPSEDELQGCNLGYRSKYVVRAARSVASGEISLERISNMPYREAREELLRLYGVGEKVADCICLFALHQLEAFPVDTHIKRALETQYKQGFPGRRYHGFQGVLQQYIFYYELAGRPGL